MNTIIERFLLPLFVIMSVLYALHSFGQENNELHNELHKVFHHKSDPSIHLELANLSLYFSYDPHIQMKRKIRNDGQEQHIFFFRNAIVKNRECRQMIQRINQEKNVYTVKIEDVQKPVKGIQLTFDFNYNNIALSYESYDSIGLQKGIVFHLYNKEILNKLNKHNKPILKTLWDTGKPCIAIDCGHGGDDTGTIGVHGIQEKDICLAIGSYLAYLLIDNGFGVVLTRKDDVNIFLDERTSYVNYKNADFFISIHANSAPNPNASGIETFCVQPPLFKKHFSVLNKTEHDLVYYHLQKRAEMTQKFAQSIQQQIIKSASFFGDTVDRKVKYSVTQVLLGAQMPSILVEVGFLSNQKEAQLLASKKYQKTIAHGIFDGIITFMSS